jgi:hypothetical protein
MAALGTDPRHSDELSLRAAQLVARRRCGGPLYRAWGPDELFAAAEEARHAR